LAKSTHVLSTIQPRDDGLFPPSKLELETKFSGRFCVPTEAALPKQMAAINNRKVMPRVWRLVNPRLYALYLSVGMEHHLQLNLILNGLTIQRLAEFPVLLAWLHKKRDKACLESAALSLM
jgi:hypothetical protein